jgi:hypothetical protein
MEDAQRDVARWRPVGTMAPMRPHADTSGSGSEHVPVTFDAYGHVSGPFLHGTSVEFTPGERIEAGRVSNFQEGRTSNNVYFTTLESTAAWGAQLATALTGGNGRGYIYVVQPTGPFEDDPNVTNRRFPGNPTRSYRSPHPLVVVERVEAWEGHSDDDVATMLANVQRLREQGMDVIDD